MAKYKFDTLSQYELQFSQRIQEIDGDVYYLIHKKTGAKLALISNEDENKVFTIGFRTPVYNSTGLPHIMEHSVLSGSKKYPLKDPFVELVKGSLNTFLNAMTYSDKTVFPVASCNDKDFANLMDVYLDAVFHPNIKERPEIFYQEGWSYRMEDADAPLKISGVVYNEMKGAYSSPEDVLDTKILNSLFPDTCYSIESGGDPKEIPNLSYQEFLDFHDTYYHPSNSYTYLYGNMDMEERLEFLDREYFGKYEKKEINSEIPVQKSFTQEKRISYEYGISQEESEESACYLSENIVLKSEGCLLNSLAMDILEYVLLDMPGASLKEALSDAGIGSEIYGVFHSEVRQPYFSIVAKNARLDQEEEFERIIEKELEKASKELSHEALLAGLNLLEFRVREADYGSLPKGLELILDDFDGFLYDDQKVFETMQTDKAFACLREGLENGWFEAFVKEELLCHHHKSFVTAIPKKGLILKEEKELEEKLARKKAAMSDREIQEIVEATKSLKAYQERPESKEDLIKIPLLTKEDMDLEPIPFCNEEHLEEGVPVIHQNLHTNGIGYLAVTFNCGNLSKEELSDLALAKLLLGLMDTKSHSYLELSTLVSTYTGGLSFVTRIHSNYGREDFSLTAEFRGKALGNNLPVLYSLIGEIITETDFSNKARMKELLAEAVSRANDSFISQGNQTALHRLLGGIFPAEAVSEQISGLSSFYYFKEILHDFDQRYEELVARMKKTLSQIFGKKTLLIGLGGDAKLFCEDKENRKALIRKLEKADFEADHREASFDSPYRWKEELKASHEGIKTASQVQYVVAAGNFMQAGYSYTASLKVLRMIMSYEYLWNRIRMQGGAYGCSMNSSRTGALYFTSYRDPHLKNTLEVYRAIPEYLRNFQADDREMTKYIIGAFGEMTSPLTNSLKIARSLEAYRTGLPYEVLQKERKEIINTDAETIRGLANMVEAVLNQGHLAVLGNEAKINQEESLFDTTICL